MNLNTVATFHLKASRWHHFVICKESRKYSWYIDGVKSGIKTMGSKISGSEFPMRIGNWYHGGRLFNGAIRKFKIYRGLLDESYIVHQWENVTQHTRE